MANEDLLLGIEAAKEGKLQEARAALARFVQSNPESEDGWLWLGHCLRTPEKREFCYQKVLALNPNHTPARQALIALQSQPPNPTGKTPPAAGQHTVSPRPAAPAENRSKPKRGNRLLYTSLGFLLVVLICGLPVAFLTLTGKLNSYMQPVAPPPTAPGPPPDVASTPLISPTVTPTVAPATATGNPTMVAMSNKMEAERYSGEARSYMLQLNFAAAIPAWNKAIALVTDNDTYYFQRATCYYSLTYAQRSQQEYRDYIFYALADLNKAIAIKPDPNYFASRYEALVALGDSTDLAVDARYFYGRAAEDMSVAISWGQAGDAKRKLAAAMIYGGQCEAGLPEVENLIKQPGQDLGYLYHLQSVAYACMGRLNEAVKAVDLSMQNGGDPRNFKHKAEYLYQLGKKQAALETINQSIEISPAYDGSRYYLRALIYVETGKNDLVQADLNTGQGNTWGRGELLAYVQGRLALEAGNQAEAVKKIQFAEASLPVTYAVLGQRFRQELADLGAQPLKLTPSPDVVAQTENLTGLPATPTSPDIILGLGTPTPMPTPTQAGSSALANRSDGTTRFVDYDGGYELVIQAGWLAFRPSAPEFYSTFEKEGQKNESLRKLMESWQNNNPNQYRMYAVFPASQEKDPRDLASLDIQRFTDQLSIDQALLSAAQNLQNQGYRVSRAELVNTSRGLSVGVIEYDATGNSAITGELLTFCYKIYLVKTYKGLLSLSLTTLDTLKDQLFPELDQVLETVTLLQ